MDFKNPHIIEFAKVCDPRGNLSFIESGIDVPFEIKRSYWIYDVTGGKHRDGHAFRKQHELIVALSGSFDVVVHDGHNEVRHHMARSYYGLYLPPMTWRKIDNFSTNSVVLVLSSELYDPLDYIEDFDTYLEQLKDYVLPSKPTIVQRDERKSRCDNPHATSSVDNCAILDLPKNHHHNGNLSVVQDNNPIPFDINRVYYLYDIPGGADRGGHSHINLKQLVVAISGSFDIVIDDGINKRRVTLNRPYQGLMITPGIWRTLDNFSSGAVCLVIASEHYEEADYIRDYETFCQLTSNKS